MKEIEVGKKFWYKGKRYRVEEGDCTDNCHSCCIDQKRENWPNCYDQSCRNHERSDNKNVVFKESFHLIQLFTRKK